MNFSRWLGLLLIVVFFIGTGPGSVVTAAQQTSNWSEGWLMGAEGYNRALEEYKTTRRPVLVYMSVTWCPYCRKFEKNVLSSPLVKDYLKDKIKVNINPENSRQEQVLAMRYQIMGFPSLFIHAPQSGRTVQIYTGVLPQEFIELIDESLK